METAYEAMYIVDTNLAAEQMDAIVEKYNTIITTGGGTVDDVDKLEPRRLAYPIKGRREGQYVVLNFRSEPEAKDEMDRIFRISDDTIRHIIVKQDKRADRFPSQTRSAEYERRERDMASRAPLNPSVAAPDAAAITDLGHVTVAHPDVAPPLLTTPLDVDDTPTTVTDTPDGMETTAEAAEEIRASDADDTTGTPA